MVYEEIFIAKLAEFLEKCNIFWYNFGKEVAFLNQIAAIAIIFITENILFTTLNVFGYFH